MPKGAPIPGQKGSDYNFVKYGDAVYVVYTVKVKGKTLKMSYRVNKEDYEAFGVNAGQVPKIGRAQFKRLDFFGNASEIAGSGGDEHPFQQFLKGLRQQYGNVSWLSNKEFVGVMLEGHLEQWDAAYLENVMKQTSWYKNRTESQREWELGMSKSDRQASLKTWQTRLMDAMDDIYGGAVDWRAQGVKQSDIKKWSERIASGRLGPPEEGLEIWLRNQRKAAENVEGSQAWIDRQKELEDQRGFLNRPEDMREQIRAEALEWLGPRGLPDNQTLRKWSEDLVSETKSEGDWQKFLRNQAKNLYPWLGTDERWQDRAGSYKRIMEESWGQPVKWDHQMLYELGETDQSGGFTGKALSYDAFERQVRSKPQFWGGSVAKEEGFELFNFLNSTFKGVGA